MYPIRRKWIGVARERQIKNQDKDIITGLLSNEMNKTSLIAQWDKYLIALPRVSYTIQNCFLYIKESTIPQVINSFYIPEWLFLAARLVRDIILAWLVFWPGSMCMLVPLPADLDPKLTSEPLTGLGWATTDDDDCNFVSFGGDRRLYRRVECSGWCCWCT